MARDTQTKTSRRRLLKQSALGAGMAGVAWSTPAILTTTRASAAGTCLSSQLDWTTVSGGTNCTLRNSTTYATMATVDGVTVQYRVVNGGGNSAGQDGFYIRTTAAACNGASGATNGFPRGLPSTTPPFPQTDDDFYSLRMTGGSRSVSIDFRFLVGTTATQMADFCFVLTDIDTNNAFGSVYRDNIRVRTLDSTGAVNAAIPVAPTDLTVTKSGTANQPTGNNPFVGAGTLVTDDSANVVVQFNSPVYGTRIEFTNQTPPAGPTGPQWIGISDLLWCTP